MHTMLRCKLMLLCAALPLLAWAQSPLPAAVLQALNQAGLPPESLSVMALPLGHRDRPFEHQARRSMQPGSAMKLVTSIVALDQLGPNHRGFTELRSSAPIQAGALQGELVLRGGGDAELGVPQLWALLLELQQAGVRHIAGDLIVDRSRYQPARLDLGLPPFDDAPEFPYNVIPDALHLAGSLLALHFNSQGAAVVAGTVPPLAGIEFDSRMTLNDARCTDWDDHWQSAQLAQNNGVTRITLNGAFPRGCSVRADLQLIDRAELTERLFRALWQGLGGSWAGRSREGVAPPDTRVLARREARPWGELLRQVNKQSDNAWTRLLFLEFGAAAPGDGKTTLQAADAAVRRWFQQHRIADEGLVLDNGSGLSRSERISPWQLTQMLKVAWAGPNAADLMMSLPTVGVDGTMRNRLKNSPATGWARLKTGTLRNVVALAGYARDARGRPWALAMIINHEQASRGRPVLDALVDQLARQGLVDPPVEIGPLGEMP
jgi:serine-type D-Ala-D-Ala carboxypeptidase/endopeptidase (penicillin-binding protein 4)